MNKAILYTCTKTFNKIEYAEDFLKGNIRFMPLNYYINIDNDPRQDKYEGVSSFYQPHLSSFMINGFKLNPKDVVGPILMRINDDQSHIFCMSAFYCKDKTKIFETQKECIDNINKPCKFKLLTFGNVTVLITNIVEFFNRIDSTVKKNKLTYKRKLVKYINLDEFHGNLEDTGFIKDLKYENESEFRFELKGLSAKSFFLNIGNINDIAVIIDTNNIDELSVENI